MQGNGQTELTEALLGLQEHVEGSITLDGKQLVGRSVRQVLDAGVGFIPEDRQDDGLVGGFSIAENLMLNRSFRSPFVRRGSLRMDALEEFARTKLKEYDVRAPGIYTHAGKLSGGNQQKVVVARELSRDLRLLVAAQPTRGVDVGSIEFIHKQVIATRDRGDPGAGRVDRARRGRRPRRPDHGALPRAGGRHRAGRHPPRDPRTDDDRRATEGRGRVSGTDETPQTEAEKLGATSRRDTGPRRPGRPGEHGPEPEAPQPHALVLREIASGNALAGVLAVVLAVAVGSLMIALTDERVRDTATYVFARPGDFFTATWDAIWGAYTALFRGAVYNDRVDDFATQIRPLTETLKFAGPLIAAGLGVGLAFRAGLFNIGGRGQMLLAGAAAGWVAFAFDLPMVIHLPLAILAGMLAGALWAGIAGVLKARTGAHEVIVTIMLNYVGFYLVFFALSRAGPAAGAGLGQPQVGARQGVGDHAADPRRALQPPPRLPAGPGRRGRRVVAAQPRRPSATGSAPSARTPAPPAPPASTWAAPTSWSC